VITSRQNKYIKLIRALQAAVKTRREQGAFVVEGVRLAEEAISANWPFSVALYSANLNERGIKLLAQLKDLGITTEECGTELLDSISDTQHSQGIILVAEQKPFEQVDNPDFVLILDAIRDPGNMGSLLRSAHAAGVDTVWLSADCADPYGPKAVRAAMGAHFHLPIRQMEWSQIAEQIASENLAVFVSDVGEGKNYRMANYASDLALIIGNEAHGVGQEARAIEHKRIHIPMHSEIDSINAVAAGAILLFEIGHHKGLL
jgi:TrmH family RNA methyltransferase